MKIIGFVLWLAILTACQHTSEPLDLIGHWHVHYPDSSFGTWDILDSNQMILNKNTFWGYYPIPGYWNMNTESDNSDTIQVAYDSQNYSDLSYNYRNDTLFLSDKSYAIKTDTSQCHLPKEFFGDLHITIELPDSKEIVNLKGEERQKYLLSFINIGKPKPHIKQFPKDTFLIEVMRGDFFITYRDIQEFVEEEKTMLPSAERDNIILALSVHKQAPAQMVDSIEQIINRYYPNLKIIYACLPGEKQYVKQSVFSSLKNDFAKPVDKPTVVLLVEVNETGELKWTLKTDKKQASSYYSLDDAENIEKLKSLLVEMKADNQHVHVRFTFAQSANFQDYIQAQTKIKQILNASNL